MLVLALQFSKGDAQRRRRQNFDDRGTLRGSGTLDLPSAAGSSMPCAEGIRDSLKTEEKTKLVESSSSRRTNPTIDSSSFDRTHQCTNWEWSRTGQDECLPTIERCSLERR